MLGGRGKWEVKYNWYMFRKLGAKTIPKFTGRSKGQVPFLCPLHWPGYPCLY